MRVDSNARETDQRDSSRNGLKLNVFIAGVVVFFAATGIQFWQYVQPYRWHEVHKVGSTLWWTNPLEWNVDGALPEIQGNIRVISTFANGKCLWIAGDAGLLAFSSDDGSSWNLLNYDSKAGNFQVRQGLPMPCAGGDVSTAMELPSVLAKVYARPSRYRVPRNNRLGRARRLANNHPNSPIKRNRIRRHHLRQTRRSRKLPWHQEQQIRRDNRPPGKQRRISWEFR